MVFVVGVVLFALGLLASIAWHECGHMWAAQRTGMWVRRYFVGFGPKVWSVRRGETEYGLKLIPLGGFCDIAGMTTYDEVPPAKASRAMYRQKAWKRLFVMVAGPVQNFILGFALIWVLAVAWGLPDLNQPPTPATVDKTQCVSATVGADGRMGPCSGAGPAATAGLRPGDEIVAADGTPVSKAADLTPIIKKSTGPVTLTVRHDGTTRTVTITPQPVTVTTDDNGTSTTETVRMIGIAYPEPPGPTQYNPLTAIPGAVVFTGDLLHKTWDSLLSLPSKVSDLWTAVTGGPRAQDTPVSVYGASVIGGEAADTSNWPMFIFLLASINFFLGLFNLVPLLPLDGGHMALIGYEKGRDAVRRWRGRAAGGPVDYMKLMPATYVVLAVMGTYMALTLTADIVNPIKLF
ncbi:M50 family metallopeptidase [Williamsia sterculiae]|uniref:Zinc metalloprotease Rip1 n=1 Tax=Williamsia sterculiae TaxID=1344003 RepID=A0A1N7GER8_9NOCA|nr:M50 family metallopeptidase [Williamsia sterculiae]SIS10976.1 RIP metalloprotease RseP [Williamsia sterculiae]